MNHGQLQIYVNELNNAAKTLTDYCSEVNINSDFHISMSNNAPSEVHRARRNVLAIASRLQTLLAEPADFIPQLATQVRHLSSKLDVEYVIMEHMYIRAEPNTCLSSMARGIPGFGIHPTERECTGQRHRRTSRCAGDNSIPSRAHDGNGSRIPLRAATRTYCAYCFVCAICHQTLLFRCCHVPSRNCCTHRVENGRSDAAFPSLKFA
jgi:hypothetical protein